MLGDLTMLGIEAFGMLRKCINAMNEHSVGHAKYIPVFSVQPHKVVWSDSVLVSYRLSSARRGEQLVLRPGSKDIRYQVIESGIIISL